MREGITKKNVLHALPLEPVGGKIPRQRFAHTAPWVQNVVAKNRTQPLTGDPVTTAPAFPGQTCSESDWKTYLQCVAL